MKKITAVFLILVLLFSAVSVSANAVTEDKLTDDLKEVLNTIDEDRAVNVRVILNYHLGGLAAIQSAYNYADKTTGIDRNDFKSYDEKSEYYRVFHIKLNEIRCTQAELLMQKLNLTFDDVSSALQYYQEDLGSYGLPTKYSLTKDRIISLIDEDEVISVDLDDKGITDFPYALIHPDSDVPEEKPNTELKELLATLADGDKVQVWVYAKHNFMTGSELDAKTNEICGKIERGATMGEVDRWRHTRNELMQQDHIDKIAALMDELSLSSDDVFVRWETDFDHSSWPYGFCISKAKILEIIKHDQIRGIEMYTGQNILSPQWFPNNAEGKITDRLRAKFNVVSESQKIEVWMNSDIVNNYANIQSVREEVSDQCGFTLDQAENIIQIMRWYSAYNTILFTARHNKSIQLIEELGISEEDYLEDWSVSDFRSVLPRKLSLTKSQIERIAAKAAEISEIYYLDLYIGQDNMSAEPVGETSPIWEDFTGTAYYKGDSDDDFVISVIDATLIQKKLAKITDDPDGVIARNGDVTGDGLDVIDATLIQKKLAGYEIKFDVGAEVIIP